MPIPPYPKNAPGPFYTENECCIICEAPYHEAKDLMAHDEGDYPHCYFKKQPETPEEVERAVWACAVSCVKAVRYSGDDPAILKRFRDLHADVSCDVLADCSPQAAPEPSPTMTGEKPIPSFPPSSDRSHPLWDLDLDG